MGGFPLNSKYSERWAQSVEPVRKLCRTASYIMQIYGKKRISLRVRPIFCGKGFK